jgi:hypothetical protein
MREYSPYIVSYKFCLLSILIEYINRNVYLYQCRRIMISVLFFVAHSTYRYGLRTLESEDKYQSDSQHKAQEAQ